jgi:hypothetical protein
VNVVFSLQDRIEIEDFLRQCCMALDTKNWADFPNLVTDDLVTDDVVWDYSDEFGVPFEGRDTVVAAISEALDPHPASIHAPPVSYIWSTGPDTAEGFSHVLSKSILDGAALPATTARSRRIAPGWTTTSVPLMVGAS